MMHEAEHYGVSLVGYLRSVAISGYRGPSALVKELVQNADDARASHLEFEVRRDCLIVRNDEQFSDADFRNIKRIASGGKRNDADATGTWGTGFTSVFQITDRPEICSRTTRLILDPIKERCHREDIPAIAGTEFTFPWRLQESELSREIQVAPWNSRDIDKFVDVLVQESLSNILFLRNLASVSVVDHRSAAERRLLSIALEPLDQPGPNIRHQTRRVTVSQEGHDDWRATWHYFARDIGATFLRAEDGAPHKKPIVQIAFGDTPKGMATKGILYNFLPTTIETGFNFHINGDFYPSSDRSTIMSGDDAKGQWNKRLIEAIARLYAESLEQVRDAAGSYTNFYRLLPIECSPSAPFLSPIVERAQRTARDGRFAWRLKGGWESCRTAARPVDPQIEQFVTDAGEQLTNLTAPGMTLAVQHYLGVKPFTLTDLADRLRDTLVANTLLGNAQFPGIRTLAGLSKLLFAFDQQIRSELRVNSHSELEKKVRNLPLALDDEGVLRRLNKDENCPALASERMRSFTPHGSVKLLNPNFERGHRDFLKQFLRELSINEVLRIYQSKSADWVGAPLESIDPALNSLSKLHLLWRTIASAIADGTIETPILREAPVIVDDDGLVRVPGGNAIIAEPEVVALFDAESVCVLHEELSTSREGIHDALQTAGVEQVGAPQLVQRLSAWCRASIPVVEAHPAINSIERLDRWFAVLYARSHELSHDDVAALRRLPVIPATDGYLRPSSELNLPIANGHAIDQALLDALPSKEVLVDIHGLSEAAGRFLKEVLHISPLSEQELIRKHVPGFYERADHATKLTLLTRIRDEVLPSKQPDDEFRNRLRTIALIHCQDGEYRKPDAVYQPTASLSEVFPDGCPRPHLETYSSRDDYQSNQWKRFFEWISLPSSPLVSDIVAEAEKISRSDPSDKRRRHQATAIFIELDDHWDQQYKHHTHALSPLVGLAWLPSQNRPGSWYRAKDLYPARFANIARSQVAVIESRPQNENAGFRDFIGLQRDVPPALIIKHLLLLGTAREATDPSSIYGYLSQPAILRSAEHELTELKDKPVIYHSGSQRWFRPDHCYFHDVVETFGDRRLSLVNAQAHRELFRLMGVRETVDEAPDAIALIKEIVEEQGNSRETRNLSDADFKSMLRAYRLLCQAREGRMPEKQFKLLLRTLAGIPCVLDRSGRLRHAGELFINDIPDLSCLFPDAMIPLAHVETDASAAHERLLEQLGVQAISRAARASVLEARSPEPARDFQQWLKKLEEPFQRLAQARPERKLVNWSQLDIARVRKLVIRWELQQAAGGRLFKGDEKEVPAHFDAKTSTIFLVSNGQQDWMTDLWPLAGELARIIAGDRFYDIKGTVQHLLDMAHDGRYNQMQAYLNKLEIPALHSSQTDLRADESERARSTATFTPALLLEEQDAVQGNGAQKPASNASTPRTPEPDPRQPSILDQTPGGSDELLHRHTIEPIPPREPTSPAGSPGIDDRLKRVLSRDNDGDESPSGDAGQSAGSTPPVEVTSDDLSDRYGAAGASHGLERAEQRLPVANGHEPSPDPVGDELLPVSRAGKVIPPFLGRLAPDVPRKAPNWLDLFQRFGQDQITADSLQGVIEEVGDSIEEQDDFPLSAADGQDDAWGDTNYSPGSSSALSATPAQGQNRDVREATFVLYGTGLTQGFFPIRSQRLQDLLRHESSVIRVVLDDGGEFDLFIDRDQLVAYNHNALRDWFQLQMIPAGAKLTLARMSHGRYRLYAHLCEPKLFENLRLLEKTESGYNVILASRECEWEVDETIYRAEARLEDMDALHAEALGKTSIFEALINLLAPQASPVSQDWLEEAIRDYRQVSASTVAQTLHQSACFVTDGKGNWSFDPSYLMDEFVRRNGREPMGRVASIQGGASSNGHGRSAPSDNGHVAGVRDPEPWSPQPVPSDGVDTYLDGLAMIVRSWNNPAEHAAEMNRIAFSLEAILREIRAMQRTVSAAARKEAEHAATVYQQSRTERIAQALDRLHADEGSEAPYDDAFTTYLSDLCDLWPDDPNVEAILHRHLDLADARAWNAVVREWLDTSVHRLSAIGQLDLAFRLLSLDESLNGTDRSSERERLERARDARQYLDLARTSGSLQERCTALEEALRLNPDYAEAQSLMDDIAEQMAERDALAAQHVIRRGDFFRAFDELKSARTTYQARRGLAPSPIVTQSGLDAAAEDLLRTCANLLPTRPEVSRTLLLGLQELLPLAAATVGNWPKVQARAMFTEAQRTTTTLDRLVLRLLAVRLVAADGSWSTAARKKVVAANCALIIDDARSLNLWDVVNECVLRIDTYDHAAMNPELRDQRRLAQDPRNASREQLDATYQRVSAILVQRSADDQLVRMLGQSFINELRRNNQWNRFVPSVT